ncbi:MAG: alanine racemase [Pseudomonadota bacterium]
MARPILTIDLNAIAENWRALDSLSAAHVTTGAAVKADGYGIGAAVAARTLSAAGCGTFFVATAPEAMEVRDALGSDAEIYVLNGAIEGLPEIVAADARPVLNARTDVEMALEFAKQHETPLSCALQFETGMNRLGLSPAEAEWLAQTDVSALSVQILMSHFACADEAGHSLTREQITRFNELVPELRDRFPNAKLSLSATGGVLLGADAHFDLTRPGVGLYGADPFRDARPVIRLEAPILRVWDVKPGETSGYGATWTATRPSRLATLPLGYADGLPRSLSGRGEAKVGGRIVPLAGRVSMDLIVLDVTDVPDAAPGDMAVLLDDELTVDRMATSAGTIGYEILTSLGDRAIRRYKPSAVTDGKGDVSA